MKSSKSKRTKETLSIEKMELVDRDYEIYDTQVSFDLYELNNLSLECSKNLQDYYHVRESYLVKYIVPQTYNFP